MSAQSTDEANSAPLTGATNVESGLKQLGSRSAQDIARDPKESTGQGGDPVVAPEAS